MSAQTKPCSASSLVSFTSLRNVSSGGMLALAEYWKDFGQVSLFMCSLSFLMESLDFLMLVSKEVMSIYYFTFPAWSLVFSRRFRLAVLLLVLVVGFVSWFYL